MRGGRQRAEFRSRNNNLALKIVFFGENCGIQFLFFGLFEGAQGCAGVRREGPRGADEASPRGRGGAMLRGFVDALDR